MGSKHDDAVQQQIQSALRKPWPEGYVLKIVDGIPTWAPGGGGAWCRIVRPQFGTVDYNQDTTFLDHDQYNKQYKIMSWEGRNWSFAPNPLAPPIVRQSGGWTFSTRPQTLTSLGVATDPSTELHRVHPPHPGEYVVHIYLGWQVQFLSSVDRVNLSTYVETPFNESALFIAAAERHVFGPGQQYMAYPIDVAADQGPFLSAFSIPLIFENEGDWVAFRFGAQGWNATSGIVDLIDETGLMTVNRFPGERTGADFLFVEVA